MSKPPDWPQRLDRLPPCPHGTRRAEGGRRLAPGTRRPITSESPLVSYVTVVRNARQTLGRTIASVQAQRWPAIEHIVIDGLSDDGTLDLILSQAGHIDYFASERDNGLYDALNKAISLAQGDLICVLNADDWLTDDAAERAVSAHRAAGSPNEHLILSSAWLMKPRGRRLWLPSELDISGYLRCANICHNAVYATPEAYRRSGPYRTDLPIAADFQWLMACVDAEVPVCVLDAPTVHYSPGGTSGDRKRHLEDCANILQRRFGCLSADEVWGLLHLFHRYRGNLEPFAARRPAQAHRFLSDLMHRHANQTDLLRTLQAAGIASPPASEPAWSASQRVPASAQLRRGLRKLRILVPALLRGKLGRPPKA